MSLQIGRVGIDVALDDIDEFSFSGDRLDLKGDFYSTTITDAKALRQQLLGYVGNPDEDFVPVTWTDDTNIDGYYRVRDAEVGSYPGRASLAGGLFPFSVSLERVASYAAPMFESILSGALLTNSNAIAATNSRPFHALPNTHLNYSTPFDPATIVSRVGQDVDGGAVTLSYYNALTSGGTGTGVLSATPTWWLPPANWYDGAATLEIAENVFIPRVVVGQQILNLPVNWRLSNGLVRVQPAANATLSIQWYDGTQWETAKTFAIVASPGTATGWNAITVLRNDPAQVTIRLGVTLPGTFFSQRVEVDVSLRRGDRIVRGYSSSTDNGIAFEIRLTSGEAGTAITGGVRASVNDAGGNRYVLISSTPGTTNAATGRLANTPSVDGSFDWGIATEIGGSGAAGIELAGNLVNAYHAAQSEKVLVVGR